MNKLPRPQLLDLDSVSVRTKIVEPMIKIVNEWRPR